MTAVPADLDVRTEESMRRQVALWRDQLLDLTRRQKLLYFRHVGVASLEIGQPAASEVLAHVDAGHAKLLAEGLGLTVANKTEEQLPAATRRLAQVAQQVFADRGVWTLHLGLGMLHWRDPADGREVDSPLVLVPVRLARTASNQPHTVVRAEDEVVLNPALVLKLERDFGLTLPPVDDFELDLPKYLDEVAEVVASREGWTVSQRTVLTTFTFLKEAIYRDLLENERAVVEHPLVQLVALGPAAPAAKDLPFETLDDTVDLDQVVAPETLHSILDADSSQRRCIIAAREGRSFVMDGPPGTGKSQTIANIIAELMAMGRSVLFVSEKAAALDVVQSRLESRGLGSFLLELHSHTAGRREVADALDKELTSRPVARYTFDTTSQDALVAARGRLTDYAAALNEVRPGLDQTLHAVIGQASLLSGPDTFGSAGAEVGPGLTAPLRHEIVAAAERLARSWRPVAEGDDFAWRGVTATTADTQTLDRLGSVVTGARSAAQALTARTRAFDEDLPLGLPADLVSVRRRVRLLELLSQSPTGVSTAWFTAPGLAPLGTRIAEVADLVTGYRDASREAADQLGDGWASLDPAAADVLDRATSAGGTWPVPTDLTGPRLHDLHRTALGLPDRVAAIGEDVRRLAPLLGLRADHVSLARTGEIARLAGIAETATPPESAWLNPTVHAALADSRRVLEQLVGVVRQRHEAVAAVFTPAALDLDLVGMRTRFHETHRGLRKFFLSARADKKLLQSVTVAQRVTKETIAALDEAIAWQQAARELQRGESDHAGRLGAYYRGTDTDFGRLTAAVDAALEAVRLAGDELDARALAGQLARDGSPDPQLSLLAHRLGDAVRGLSADLDASAPGLQTVPLEEVPSAASALVAALEPVLPVVDGAQAVAGRDLTLAECRRGLAAVGTAVAAQAALLDTRAADEALLGPAYAGTDTDLEALRRALAFCAEVRELTGGPIAPSVAVHVTRPALSAAELQEPVDAFDRSVGALCAEFSPDRATELRADLEASVPGAEDLLAELADTVRRDVPEWCAHVDRRADLASRGLGGVVEALAATRVPADRVAAEVERAALVAWIDEVVRADPRLQEYRSDDRDALVERFRRLDTELVANAHAAVVEACTARRPRTVLGDASHIRREAEKKSRHIPVRELLRRSGTVAQQLKPCFMMSPLAVSQYLPPSLRFDAVIFDEASQVAPWDAVNCIYRGDQLIVAGDEKQLPPTAFFDAAQEELEDGAANELLEEFESVLSACKGAGAMTALPLSWHYRSRHEDLITFSNVTFYGGRLNTFPGARFEADDLGVVSHLVPGVYDRGGRRDNVVEARQVVDRVVHHHRTNPTLTVGVVTLSVPQADAVERELERRAEEDRSLEPLLERGDRLGGFFVKNLENVQGDERDVIIFSTGYGPDETGKVTMNFGPLTQKGGWRRLNVAVTRARRRVEVVTSLQHGQIAARSNESHAALRDYLHFAARGPEALAIDLGGSQGPTESPFEEDVLSVIRSLGYDAVPQVGTAGYRIDLGVQHPTVPGEYVLGVECDGAAYHSAQAARDRDRLRQSVLEGLGWRIHRIWGISWWRDRRGQTERLRAAIEDAVRGGPPAPVAAPAVVPEVVVEEFDVDARPEWAQPYERYRARKRESVHELHTVEARPQIRSWVEGLLSVEAPIHEDLLLERFRDDFSTRLGARIRANVLEVLSRAQSDGQVAERSPKGFWSHRTIDVVRVPVDESTTRPVEHVPPEEVRAAVSHLVADAGSVPPADLVDGVRRTFRWARSTPEVVAAVETEVEVLVARGELLRSEDRLRAPQGS